jgi:UDP-N-acetyl-2-amino-2-deoxyglucuronate dehydrogenase
MNKLRTGIIGAGKVAHLHAKALLKIEMSDLRAVFNWKKNKAVDFAIQYDLRAYDDIGEMIAEEDLDMVTVCTPHPAHLDTVIPALKAGAHVIVEKPLAVSLEDCDRMIRMAEEMNLLLGMISQRRLYQPVMRVKQAIEKGKIGKPILGIVYLFGWRGEDYYKSDPWRGKWELEGGGILVNQAPHQLDLFQWYMGDIDELFGYWANFNHPYIEVEDTASAVVKFRDGAFGSIIVSNSQNPALYGKVHVFGSNGAAVGVQTDGGAMFIAGMSTIEEAPFNDLWSVPGEEKLYEQWRKEDEDFFRRIDPVLYYHQWQLRDFIECIQDKRIPMVTGKEGRKTVEIFNAIYESNSTGKPVKFPLRSI